MLFASTFGRFLVTKWESLYSTLFGTGVETTRFEPDGVEPSFTPVIDESYRVVAAIWAGST